MMRWIDTSPVVEVDPAEYARLLGLPPRRPMDSRTQDHATLARTWYAANGRPWTYAREIEQLKLLDNSVRLDGVPFGRSRFLSVLRDAQAHGAILAAVSAGPELEAEAHRAWIADRPDEYFFLQSYGSAVVERLIVMLAARLCGWADSQQLAVLPHYSPGFVDWDIAEQPRLLGLVNPSELPGPLGCLASGMLFPIKSQLAVFGVTRQLDRVRRLTDLVPCQSCTLHPCAYRRVPYRDQSHLKASSP